SVLLLALSLAGGDRLVGVLEDQDLGGSEVRLDLLLGVLLLLLALLLGVLVLLVGVFVLVLGVLVLLFRLVGVLVLLFFLLFRVLVLLLFLLVGVLLLGVLLLVLGLRLLLLDAGQRHLHQLPDLEGVQLGLVAALVGVGALQLLDLFLGVLLGVALLVVGEGQEVGADLDLRRHLDLDFYRLLDHAEGTLLRADALLGEGPLHLVADLLHLAQDVGQLPGVAGVGGLGLQLEQPVLLVDQVLLLAAAGVEASARLELEGVELQAEGEEAAGEG